MGTALYNKNNKRKKEKQSTSRDPLLHKDIIQIEKQIVLQTSKIKKIIKKKNLATLNQPYKKC